MLRLRPPDHAAASGAPARGAVESSPRRAGARAAVAVALVLGVGLRFATTSALWIDEALTVNISRLAVPDLLEALRHDGSPPLFYLLLHVWMAVVGSSDVTVRALPGLLSVAALPAAWALGRRIAGDAGAWAGALLLASSPFVIRYATETRPYALEVLLALLGALAVARALERPDVGRLAAVAAATAGLLLTHYWSLYLVAVAGIVVLALATRPAQGRAALRVAAAMAVGGVAFLPWLPSFLFQAEHTGTPWAARPTADKIWFALRAWGGGDDRWHVALGTTLLAVTAIGLRRAPALAATVVGTLLVAWIACRTAPAAFVPRYTAVVVGPALVLAGVGARRLGTPVLGGLVVAGLVLAGVGVDDQRTQAPEVAAAIAATGRPGDIVVYCPDQLGPATSRLLPEGFRQLTYPASTRPELVDWVDYEQRNEAAEPWDFAQALLAASAPGQRIFLVWHGAYRTFQRDCQRLVYALRGARDDERLVERDRSTYYEPMWLDVFTAAG